MQRGLPTFVVEGFAPMLLFYVLWNLAGAMIEAIDDDLLRRGLTDRSGKARTLIDLRVRLSGRLQRWLREFGATPASRVEWVGQLAQGESLVDVVRKEVGEGIRLLEAAQARGDVARAPTGETS
jgi:hypothetical protein